jgi:hypothetical protein
MVCAEWSGLDLLHASSYSLLHRELSFHHLFRELPMHADFLVCTTFSFCFARPKSQGFSSSLNENDKENLSLLIKDIKYMAAKLGEYANAMEVRSRQSEKDK